MIRPSYITLTRQDLKKIVKEISNPDLANIVGKWKPYSSAYFVNKTFFHTRNVVQPYAF